MKERTPRGEERAGEERPQQATDTGKKKKELENRKECLSGEKKVFVYQGEQQKK